MTGRLLKGFVNGFKAEMDELVAVSHWRKVSFVPKARQIDEVITHFARVAFDSKFGISGTARTINAATAIWESRLLIDFPPMMRCFNKATSKGRTLLLHTLEQN